jgi:glutamine---fructose-6-phosphate transaminase (isomerizing)
MLDLSVIRGPYFRDLLDQPEALAATLAGLESSPALLEMAVRLRGGEFQRVVLTGMGSSYHALHPLSRQLAAQGFTAVMEETSELIHYKTRWLDAGSLILAVSQSGQSVEIVRLLELNAGRAPIVAVTNTPGSPLAQQAGATVLTRAGAESSVSCKTYVTALMALQWLGDRLCGHDLENTHAALAGAAAAAGEFLGGWEQHVTRLLGQLEGVRHLFLTGRGASLAAAGAGALIIKESTRVPAEAMSCAALRHGPMEMVSPATFVLVFAGSPPTRALNTRLVSDLLAMGARAELAAEHAPSEALRPILEILPVQMITLALAAAAGRQPGRFERLTKITTTE